MRVTRDREPATPIPIAAVVEHLHANGLAAEITADAFAGSATGDGIVETEVLEILFRVYGRGAVVGVAANERAVRDGVIVFKESHAVEDEEEDEARRDIAAVVARFGATVREDDLEDMGDTPSIARVIEATLVEAGRPERTRVHDSKYYAITVVLIRERLVAGPLRFCSPVEAG